MNLIQCETCKAITQSLGQHGTFIPEGWLVYQLTIKTQNRSGLINFHLCPKCIDNQGLGGLTDSPHAAVQESRESIIEDFLALIAQDVTDQMENQ